MMNSAWHLHELLENWAPGDGESVRGARERAIGTNGRHPFWKAHGQAVMLLIDIERLLDGMEAEGMRVEMFKKALPGWYEAVFATRLDWTQRPPQRRQQRTNVPQRPSVLPAHKSANMDVLAALGTALDGFQQTEDLDELTLQDLVDTLVEAEEVARLLDDLPKDERVYLLGLIEEAQRAAKDIGTFGSSRARLSAMQLGAALVSVSERTSKPGLRERVKNLYVRLLGLGWSGATKAVETGAAETVKEIMSGE